MSSKKRFGKARPKTITDNHEVNIFGYVVFALRILFFYMAQSSLGWEARGVHPHPIVRTTYVHTTYVHTTMRLAAVDDLGLDLESVDASLDANVDLAVRAWINLGAPFPDLHRKVKGGDLAAVVQQEVVKSEEAHRQLQTVYAEFSWIPASVWKEHGT